MTLYKKATLDDGSTVIVDNHTGTDVEQVLKPGQWEVVSALPHDDQRAKMAEFAALNQADPTGGRTEVDEQALDTARDASSGEAHQEQERG